MGTVSTDSKPFYSDSEVHFIVGNSHVIMGDVNYQYLWFLHHENSICYHSHACKFLTFKGSGMLKNLRHR